MSDLDERLQRVRAFLHFQRLNPDKCHVSPEAEDAIAFAAEIERLRGALKYISDLEPGLGGNIGGPTRADYAQALGHAKDIACTALADSASHNSLAAASQPSSSVSVQQVKYGCHCDIESMPDGYEPDACVMDDGLDDMCVYARQLRRDGKDKTSCSYWKPIKAAASQP